MSGKPLKSGKANPWVLLALTVLLLVAIAASCLFGMVDIKMEDLWIAFEQWRDEGKMALKLDYFLNFRIPRVLMSVLVGAVLSVCGAAYQSIFRNPLTDPYILGVSSGASLGAAIAFLVGLNAIFWGVEAMALVTALLTVMLIYWIASTGNRMHITTLLLTGICLTLLISAIISFLIALNPHKMDSIYSWTMGSFANRVWDHVLVLLPIAAGGIGVTLWYGRDLNLLLAGSEAAKSMGVEVEKVRRVLLLVTTVMVAFAVSTCGVIGFVGLIVPHAVRLVVGSDNRKVIPYSVLCGAIFVLLCDMLAHTVIYPGELPVGSLTSMVGAPMFIYLLYKSKKRY